MDASGVSHGLAECARSVDSDLMVLGRNGQSNLRYVLLGSTVERLLKEIPCSVPVVHRGTPDAMRGGKVYLTYTLVGGTVLLLAVVWLHHLAGPVMFKERGAIEVLLATHRGELQVLFLLFMLGIGVKAAIVPLHGWLTVWTGNSIQLINQPIIPILK